MDTLFEKYCQLRLGGWSVDDLRLIFARKTIFFEDLFRKFHRPPMMLTA